MDEVEVLGVREIARTLGISPPTVEKLLRSGLGGSTIYRAIGPRPQLFVEPREILELQQWPYINSHPAAFVVNVSPNAAVGETGWHRERTGDTNRDGVAGWWPVANPEQLCGLHLIAVLSTFVVEVHRINAWTRDRGRVRFELGRPAAHAKAAFVKHRVHPVVGPLAYYLDASE